MKVVEITTRQQQGRYLKGRVYFSTNETILENLMNRRSRPYKEYRKMFPEIWEKMGVGNMEVRWSQRAGCGCGCSPGFIVDGLYGKNVWVDLGE